VLDCLSEKGPEEEPQATSSKAGLCAVDTGPWVQGFKGAKVHGYRERAANRSFDRLRMAKPQAAGLAASRT